MYNTVMIGTLYIVATPIGNLGDITLRAVETLKTVDLILCEDTRLTGNLLHHLGIKKDMQNLNDTNEENKLYEVITQLEAGSNIALVSDAGTPLISDPGFKLVREAHKRSIAVITIPGASSVVAALSISGLPTDKFLFLGFPPDSPAHKLKFFKEVQEMLKASNKMNPTIVFFESPHKLLKSFAAIKVVFGDIDVVVAREMTKIYEEILRNTVTQLEDHFTQHAPKGEFVVMFKL